MWKLIILFLCLDITASAQLTADFSATITKGCTPLTVQFNDLSTGDATSWFWDFGNGQTSYEQNPVVTYTTSGNFTVRLIIRNVTEQNFKEKVSYINVAAPPVVDFSIMPIDSGCAPLQPTFSDQSGISNTGIKNRVWDFGDGTTSNQQNVQHTYNATGRYTVSLSIETVEGCITQNSKFNAIRVGAKPTADFSASPLDGCASTFRNFRNQSSTGISGVLWDFGDGSQSNERSLKYHYQDTGTFNVKLKVSSNGCEDSITKINYEHISGPLAKIQTLIDCSQRFGIQFQDKSLGEIKRVWDFGDGQTSANSRPFHMYSSLGLYVARLFISGTTCNDTAYDTIYIKTGNPQVSILPAKNIYCKNDTLKLIVTDFDGINTKGFAWNFGDSISPFTHTNDTVSYAYKSNQTFSPTVFVRNNQGCLDSITIRQPINVNGPTAKFTALNACTNSLISFADQSISGINQPINQWLWSYGDGDTSTDKNPLNYTYIFPGTYNVNLKVTDVNNCIDTITKPIEIFNSPTVNAGNDTLVCAASSITLNASGATDYVWNTNSDLSCTTCANPIAKPNQQVTYIVTGTSNGCADTDSINVNVITKQNITAIPSSYTLCAGDTTILNVSGADRFSWSPASSLNSSVSATPFAFPAATTTYTIVGNDSLNCFSDSALVTVNVNPKPTIDISESYVQLITGSQYTILASASADAQNLQWVPVTGLSCSNCLQPTTTVYNTANYTLYATNSFGCSDSDKITLYAICTDQSVFIPNTFSPNNDGMNDYFFPRSQGDPVIKSFTVFNRLGQIVYQKRNVHPNNANEGWDGTYNNKIQNPDVYVYVMEIQCSGTRPFLKKGSVSLVR